MFLWKFLHDSLNRVQYTFKPFHGSLQGRTVYRSFPLLRDKFDDKTEISRHLELRRTHRGCRYSTEQSTVVTWYAPPTRGGQWQSGADELLDYFACGRHFYSNGLENSCQHQKSLSTQFPHPSTNTEAESHYSRRRLVVCGEQITAGVGGGGDSRKQVTPLTARKGPLNSIRAMAFIARAMAFIAKLSPCDNCCPSTIRTRAALKRSGGVKQQKH